MEGKIEYIHKIMSLFHKNTKDNEIFREWISKYLSTFFLNSKLKSYRNSYRINLKIFLKNQLHLSKNNLNDVSKKQEKV